MNAITIYTAACRDNVQNSHYPQKHIITNLKEFREAVAFDHVCAEYRGCHRSNADFMSADCLMMDCDNVHSDLPSDWVTPEHVSAALPGLQFYVCYSRHNGKSKDGRSPRPKFHVYFPIDIVADAKVYARLKNSVIAQFPRLHFDTNAMDSARFFFGVHTPEVLVMGDKEH